MHIKSSPDWDIGRAVAFAESIGYDGLYTIEAFAHDQVRSPSSGSPVRAEADYSHLSATIGSTRVARRAGR